MPSSPNNTNRSRNNSQTSPAPHGEEGSAEPAYVFKYIAIGDAGVGKSSIMNAFVNGNFDPTRGSTVGVEFDSRQLQVGDNVALIQIWDTAGQERFRSVTRQYYRGAACALLIYDISRRSTFTHLTNWLSDAKAHTNPHTVILLVGNKADLADQRQVSYEEASQFANENKIHYIETSAKTCSNVEQAFMLTAKKIFANIETGVIDESDKNSGVEFPLVIDAQPPAPDKGCAC